LIFDPAFAKFGFDFQLVVIRNYPAVASESERVGSCLFVFLWDPGLLDAVALQELVLVLHLILDAANLVIELIRYVILLSFNVI